MEKREGKKRESREGERKERERKKLRAPLEILLLGLESKGILTLPIVFLCYHHKICISARNQHIVSIE